MSGSAVVAEARRHVAEGAHYIKKGYGHKFNLQAARIDDVVPGRDAAVRLFARGGQMGLPAYVRFAARSELGGIRVCAGRCFKFNREGVGMPTGDPDNATHLATPERYVWRRPLNFANAPRQVLGECCAMKRHFDCIGFVSYCFWKTMSYPPNAGFVSIENWKDTYSTPLAPLSQLQPGDILFSSTGSSLPAYDYDDRPRVTPLGTFTHIGIAISSSMVIHSAGCELGVMITEISSATLPNGDTMRWETEGGRPRCFR
jgi:cell wall-associated NlpC family hydrolase